MPKENSIIETYKSVLSGQAKTFPKHFWSYNENATTCTRYLIEEILNYSLEDIKTKVSLKTFINHKLAGMIQNAYNDSPYNAINDAYPNLLHPWEMNWCPMKFWDSLENRQAGFMWLYKELNLNHISDFKAVMFRQKNMTGLIDKYNGRLNDLIAELYIED